MAHAPTRDELVAWDKRYVWHPFTQMTEWMAPEWDPVVVARGEGTWLVDVNGRRYLDGNASIWTSVHGHGHPRLREAILRQLARLEHASFLGLTNDVAPQLARALAEMLAPGGQHRVFFCDDGSTAVETALKMAWQARRQRGEATRCHFVSLSASYHGDTVGAMGLGHVPVFHQAYGGLMKAAREVPMPNCYRCPFNRARPQRGRTAVEARECGFECAETVLKSALDEAAESAIALVMEPRVQAVAGFVVHPEGFLKRASELCKERGIWLMLDEVMTGVGRTGTFFACQSEGVVPDLIALAKGLSGGTMPLGATLASEPIFEAFLGDYTELKTFFHGFSYTGHPLGCAAALENLRIFQDEHVLERVGALGRQLASAGTRFWEHPNVGDVRGCGGILAIELVRDFERRERFAFADRMGARVCEAARRRGLLTRPIGDVLVVMPPFCAAPEEVTAMAAALWEALHEVIPV